MTDRCEHASGSARTRVVLDHESDSGSSLEELQVATSVHERPVLKMEISNPGLLSPIESSETSEGRLSIDSSVERYHSDFDAMKCKVKIFGESLNLCRCIAFDVKSKLYAMEKRLKGLENKHTVPQANYSAIIKKNKQISNKSQKLTQKLQMCGSEAEMKEVACRICKNYLHGAWKTCDIADMEFRKITGGLSNFIYYVGLPEDPSKWAAKAGSQSSNLVLVDEEKPGAYAYDEPKKVLLRIYGQVHGERAMDAIVTESVIFTLLSERRLGPKLYGVFSGGRIEECIPARCLLVKELSEPAISMKVAEKMAAIHSMEIPLSKEPFYIWKTMNKWLKTVREERLATNKGRTEDEQAVVRRLKLIDYEKELEWLRKYLATVDSPVVFCHNDLQEGNILILEGDHSQQTSDVADDFVSYVPSSPFVQSTPFIKSYGMSPRPSQEALSHSDIPMGAMTELTESNTTANALSRASFIENMYDHNTSDSHISDSGEPKLVLIDFEYCAYNYRGFDIANHFQEWLYDYTNDQHPFYFENQENSPTLEQKEIFIKEYLKHYHANTSEGKEPAAPSIDAVNHLLNEVEAFALASHLFWSLWAIVNAGKSQIPFGYWEYSLSRIETYLRLKQEVMKDDGTNRAQKRKICEVDI